MLRDVLDIAAHDPWSFPAFDSRDPEGEDVRSASVGQLSTVYWINRPAGRLYVIGIVWLGQGRSSNTGQEPGRLPARWYIPGRIACMRHVGC
ncbi:hypothetical protein KPP03845_100764 [Streptomyces xanthophaeus]|nr:hypothetical protein KPP03845_100764 [Streptomyces xanthophaeus]